jgi:hypothetical protein
VEETRKETVESVDARRSSRVGGWRKKQSCRRADEGQEMECERERKLSRAIAELLLVFPHAQTRSRSGSTSIRSLFSSSFPPETEEKRTASTLLREGLRYDGVKLQESRQGRKKATRGGRERGQEGRKRKGYSTSNDDNDNGDGRT